MKVSVSKSKNQSIKDIMLKYSSSTLIKKESCRSVNVGYLLEKKLGESYTTESIIRTLKEMNMLIAPGEGYIPEYTYFPWKVTLFLCFFIALFLIT